MKPQWPTLEGRLNQPLTSTLDALKQLKAGGIPLSPHAAKLMIKELEKQRRLARAKAVNQS